MGKEEKPSLHQRRIKKELNILESQILDRVRWEMPILSKNIKCGVSLDLPLLNCQPTLACSTVCYAAQGRQSYSKAIIKSLAVNRMILEEPERAARKAVDESRGIPIRLAGSGEVLPQHKPFLNFVEQFGGSYWGFTRRIDTHIEIPSLMFSLDATSSREQLEYVKENVPVNRRAYLRRAKDPACPIEVAVTFPSHGPQTNEVQEIREEDTDCPAVRKYASGCWECKRCY